MIRLESGASTQLTNLIRVLRALDLLANFQKLVPAPLASPLAQLQAKAKERKRASRRAAVAREAPPASAWKWGDQRDGKREGDR